MCRASSIVISYIDFINNYDKMLSNFILIMLGVTQMSNIIDYIKWRGDLTFSQDSFNDIDNLILSQLAYIDFTDIVVPSEISKGIPLKDAADKFFAINDEEELLNHVSMTKNSIFIFKEMASSNRFRDIILSHYINDINEDEQSQFSAITTLLDDSSIYVAFSGTDSTLIGWHEDFNMLYMKHTPGHFKAVNYLNSLGVSDLTSIRLGGHSKGGNFALYAGMHCNPDIFAKIIKIYNNDGPGFSQDIVNTDNYKKILPITKTIIPESSVVGMLFEHQESYEVVKSDNKGLKQHDALSWQVLGNHFIYAKSIGNQSLNTNKAIDEWLNLIPKEQRKDIVDAVFVILNSAGIETVDDFFTLKLRDIINVMQTGKSLPKETSEAIIDATLLLIKMMVKANKKDR